MAKKTLAAKTISASDEYNKLLKKYQNGISSYGKKIDSNCYLMRNIFSRVNNDFFPHVNEMLNILDDCQNITGNMASRKTQLSKYDYWRILRMQTQAEDVDELLQDFTYFETIVQGIPKAIIDMFETKVITIPEIVKQLEQPGKIEKKQLQDSYNELLAILDDNKKTHQRYKKELISSLNDADISEMIKIGRKLNKSVQIDPLKDGKVTKLMKDELIALEQEYFRYKKASQSIESANKEFIMEWTNSPINSFLETDFISQTRELLIDVLNFIKETAQHGKFQLESYISLENRLYDMQNQLDEYNEEDMEDYHDGEDGLDFMANELAEGFANEFMSMLLDKMVDLPENDGGHLKRIK